MKKTYCFGDVLLEPRYSNIVSRSEIDLTSKLNDLNFSLPVISSPMDTVTDSDMLVAMDASGALGIVHRYNTISDQI